MPDQPRTIYTVGHSTRPLDEFLALLKEFGVETLVDVRSVPRSARHPRFNIESLGASLSRAGIAYVHIPALGGLRKRAKDAPPSPNTGWSHAAFRNFADHALTPAFRAGLAELLALGQQRVCAVMCSEAVWWRCHRRIITDYLLARAVPVVHILGPCKSEPAKPTPFASAQPGGDIHYPDTSAEAPSLWSGAPPD